MQFWEDKYNSTGGQLVVIYGRRRVGKTETLRQFCKGKQHVFFACRECTDRLQLRNFSEKILKENIPASLYINEFSDWEKAFRAVLDLPYGDNKKLLVIDEFPYMCKGNGSIPSILQNLWDEILRNENVMIILCGSAMSFMEKELLAEKNPLYGRTTGIYKMKEMSFYDAIKFFPDYSERDKVFVYSVLGGIPHYLKQFDPELSIEENIKKNILTKGCTLYIQRNVSAFTFEDICREYIREMQKARTLPFRYAKMGRWSGKTTVRSKEGAQIAETEIDIVAVSSQNQEYLIGECKFKGRPFSYTEYLDTIAKLAPQKEKAQFFYILFSESGFDEKIESEAENDPYLRLCTLEKIVNLKA